jgi:hypothetical protein
VTYDADNAANASKAYGVTTTTVKKGDDVIYFKTAAGVQYLIDVTQSVYGKNDAEITAVRELYNLIVNDVVAGTYTGTLAVADGVTGTTFKIGTTTVTEISTDNSSVTLTVEAPDGYTLASTNVVTVSGDTTPTVAQNLNGGTNTFVISNITGDFTLTFKMERSAYYAVKAGSTPTANDYYAAEYTSGIALTDLTGNYALIKGADGNYYDLGGTNKGSSLTNDCYVAITEGSVSITKMPATDLTVTDGYYKLTPASGDVAYYTANAEVAIAGVDSAFYVVKDGETTPNYYNANGTKITSNVVTTKGILAATTTIKMPAADVTVEKGYYSVTLDDVLLGYYKASDEITNLSMKADYYTDDAGDTFAASATTYTVNAAVAANVVITSGYRQVSLTITGYKQGTTDANLTDLTITNGKLVGSSVYVQNGAVLTIKGDSFDVTIGGNKYLSTSDGYVTTITNSGSLAITASASE